MERKTVDHGNRLPAARHPDGRGLAAKFEAELDAIDALAPNRPELIGDVGRRMDAACDIGDLTVREWRALIDKVSAARAKPPMSRPGPRSA